MTEVDSMNKEKSRKESDPLDEAQFTGASTGMSGKTLQQKTTQKSAESNETGSMKQ
jgi:hypothetical protein